MVFIMLLLFNQCHLPVPFRQYQVSVCCIWVQGEMTGICRQKESLIKPHLHIKCSFVGTEQVLISYYVTIVLNMQLIRIEETYISSALISTCTLHHDPHYRTNRLLTDKDLIKQSTFKTYCCVLVHYPSALLSYLLRTERSTIPTGYQRCRRKVFMW